VEGVAGFEAEGAGEEGLRTPLALQARRLMLVEGFRNEEPVSSSVIGLIVYPEYGTGDKSYEQDDTFKSLHGK
jgi:hypothetical protein